MKIHDVEDGIDFYDLRANFSEDQISKAVEVMNKFRKKKGMKEIDYKNISTGTGCSECGGLNLIRTGTCHVCATCGASQGCS